MVVGGLWEVEMPMTEERSQLFREFARVAEPRLRHALVARHGADRGAEAANDALLHGWRHWDRVRSMDNPVGYLYRVGQSKARQRRRKPDAVPLIPEDRPPWIEPQLSAALGGLTPRQREVVVLVGAFEYTHHETAEMLGISDSSVKTHLSRGMDELRRRLGVNPDV